MLSVEIQHSQHSRYTFSVITYLFSLGAIISYLFVLSPSIKQSSSHQPVCANCYDIVGKTKTNVVCLERG